LGAIDLSVGQIYLYDIIGTTGRDKLGLRDGAGWMRLTAWRSEKKSSHGWRHQQDFSRSIDDMPDIRGL